MMRMCCAGLFLLVLIALAACGSGNSEEAKRHALMERADLAPAENEHAARHAVGASDAAPVEDSASNVLFEPEVHRLLLGRCQGCHDGGRNPDSGFPLYGDAARDFTTARALVDTADPESSALMEMSAGEGHPGGPVFGRDSEDHALLVAWAKAGAHFDGERTVR